MANKRILSVCLVLVPLILAVASPNASATSILISPTINNGSFENGIFGTGTASNCAWVGCMDLNPLASNINSWAVAEGQLSWIDSPTFTAFGSFPASDGTRWLDLSGSADGTPVGAISLALPLATSAGQRYHVSFDLGNSRYDGTNLPGIDVLVGGTSIGSFSAPGQTGSDITWTTKSFDFTATSGSTSLQFKGVGTGGIHVIGLDNVNVSAVPEPSSLFVLVAGVTALGLLAGRSRRK